MADISWDTPTMAELFYKQGHLRRAVGIYRKVVRDTPDNVPARQRLEQLEAELVQQQGAPMGFREHMQRIVDQTPGAIASTIMGFDGLAIDSYEVGGGEVDLPSLVIEYSAAAQQLKRASGQAGGALVEMAVTGSNLSMLLRPISDEYFLAVVLGPRALTGKARYLMRVAAPQIAKELA